MVNNANGKRANVVAAAKEAERLNVFFYIRNAQEFFQSVRSPNLDWKYVFPWMILLSKKYIYHIVESSWQTKNNKNLIFR